MAAVNPEYGPLVEGIVMVEIGAVFASVVWQLGHLPIMF